MPMGIPPRAGRPYKAARRIPLTGGSNTAFGLQPDRLWAVPFEVHRRIGITKLGLYMTTGVAAQKARLGIAYDAERTGGTPGAPTDLLAELAAEVDISSSNAHALGPFAATQWLDPGLWWALVVQTSWTTQCYGSGVNTHAHWEQARLIGVDVASGPLTAAPAVYKAHTYGALPASFGTPTYGTGGMPVIWAETE